MDKEEISRRMFLIKSCAGVGAAWLSSRWPEIVAAQRHAHNRVGSSAPGGFEFFTPEQAAEIEAVAAQIIPTDDTPGAREACVIHFIDRALMTFDSDKQSLYLEGLAQLQSASRNPSLKAKKFSDLKSENQIKALEKIQHTAFFEQVRLHTIMGFLSDPAYGGNCDQTGWKHINFDAQYFHKPPFGFYDR